MIRVLVSVFCAWLMICYLFLAFKSWDSIPSWLYYIWDKSFGGGFIMWLCLYWNVKSYDRYVVAPVVVFCFLRFLLDVFSAFTGITAANEWRVAALFILLIAVFYVLTLKRSNIFHKWISKLLFN